MMDTMRIIGAPLAALGFALWAALCGLAGEANSGLPRVFAGSHGPAGEALPPSRRLFVAHLALLCLAGAGASTAVAMSLTRTGSPPPAATRSTARTAYSAVRGKTTLTSRCVARS